MKIFKFLAMLTISVLLFTGCEKEEITNYAFQEISAPTNVKAMFDVTQDDSGMVTISPSGEGAQVFQVYFGESADESPVEVLSGESITHAFGEGEYMVRVVGVGSTGLTSEYTQKLVISFRAPENLEVTVNQGAANPETITVTASADYATLFDVYFGDTEDEEPTQLMPDSSVEHTYAETGNYTLRVVARGAGAATIEESVVVVVGEGISVILSKMLENFEGDAPSFIVFGNIADTEVISNPDISGLNITSKVAKLTKTAGSEVWAGTLFETEEPVDLDNYSFIRLKTWSPKVGAVVKVKLENADASITHEIDVETTVANEWEELIYDFSGAPAADYVKVVVFYDFGNNGDDSVFYFDEIELTNIGREIAMNKFQDLEGTAPGFTSFGNIADIEVIDNPDPTGVNATSKVAKLTKTAGSEVWAGALFETTETVDLTNYNQIGVYTWSPKVGAVVKVKLENADASIVHEVDMLTTVNNEWEQLVYDFSDAPAADYVKVVIFFDFGNNGDDSVYYFDEFSLIN